MHRSPLDRAARLNAVAVCAEDLLRTAAAIHRLPPEQRDWRARAMCARAIFKDGPSDKAYAVTARLEAMRQLIEAGEVPETFAPLLPNGVRALAESVFEAAAREPLVCEDHACYFERHGFVARMLDHAALETEDSPMARIGSR